MPGTGKTNSARARDAPHTLIPDFRCLLASLAVLALPCRVIRASCPPRRILANCRRTKVLILTSHAISDSIAKALAAGASGAVLKSAENKELVSAIRAIASGDSFVSAEIQGLMDTDPPVTGLTGRQSEVLQSLTLGLTNKDIAVQLGISIRSVEEHVNNILEKIGAANRAEAVGIALRKHLVKI